MQFSTALWLYYFTWGVLRSAPSQRFAVPCLAFVLATNACPASYLPDYKLAAIPSDIFRTTNQNHGHTQHHSIFGVVQNLKTEPSVFLSKFESWGWEDRLLLQRLFKQSHISKANAPWRRRPTDHPWPWCTRQCWRCLRASCAPCGCWRCGASSSRRAAGTRSCGRCGRVGSAPGPESRSGSSPSRPAHQHTRHALDVADLLTPGPRAQLQQRGIWRRSCTGQFHWQLHNTWLEPHRQILRSRCSTRCWTDLDVSLGVEAVELVEQLQHGSLDLALSAGVRLVPAVSQLTVTAQTNNATNAHGTFTITWM